MWNVKYQIRKIPNIKYQTWNISKELCYLGYEMWDTIHDTWNIKYKVWDMIYDVRYITF